MELKGPKASCLCFTVCKHSLCFISGSCCHPVGRQFEAVELCSTWLMSVIQEAESSDNKKQLGYHWLSLKMYDSSSSLDWRLSFSDRNSLTSLRDLWISTIDIILKSSRGVEAVLAAMLMSEAHDRKVHRSTYYSLTGSEFRTGLLPVLCRLQRGRRLSALHSVLFWRHVCSGDPYSWVSVCVSL